MTEHPAAGHCPFCGGGVGPEPTPPVAADVGRRPKKKFPAAIFFLLLLGPPFLTMLAAAVIRVPNEPISQVIGFFGGGSAGVTCGVLLGCRVGETSLGRSLFSLFLGALMAIVCITLCCVGCAVGGYQFVIR